MILIICIGEGVIDLGFICMDGGVSRLDHDWHIFVLVYAHHLLTGDHLPSLQYQQLEFSFLTLVCGDLNRRRSTANSDSMSHILFYEKQSMYYFLQQIRHQLGPNFVILPRLITPEGIKSDGTHGIFSLPAGMYS